MSELNGANKKAGGAAPALLLQEDINSANESESLVVPNLPCDWRFCKVQGKKPLDGAWQKNGLTASQIQRAMDAGECTGYGLLTGYPDLMAIDVDGERAHNRLMQLYAENGVSSINTVAWTSGKPFRYQLLFRLKFQDGADLFLKTGVGRHFEDWREEGEDYQQLDFRFNGFQSVLPPSLHPDGGRYQWINAPETTEVANAPDWLIAHIAMVVAGGGHHAPAKAKKVTPAAPLGEENGNGKTKTQEQKNTPLDEPKPETDKDKFGRLLDQEIIPRIDAMAFYGVYTELTPYAQNEVRGICPLHEGAENPTSFSVDLGTKQYHCFSCEAKGSVAQFLHEVNGNVGKLQGQLFIQTVKELAKKVNIPVPDDKPPKHLYTSELAGDEQEQPCRRLRAIRLLEREWGDKLKFNLLTGDIEFAGEVDPVEVSSLYLRVARAFNRELPKEETADICVGIAKSNAYHPIQQYLDSVAEKYTDTSIIETIAERYFGTTAPIYNNFVKLALLGAVIRVYEPGAKWDYVPILQGGQGIGKSSFFRVLAGDDWFDDSLGSSNDKDERLKLHRSWITEWSELEAVFGRKDQATVKSFITTQTDLLRPPYEKEVRPLKRRGIIVGSTNQTDFLNDPTGNRRFWVIPVNKQIDIRLLAEERDRIWAAAVHLYRSGHPRYLTQEQSSHLENLNKGYEASDTWEDVVLALLKGMEEGEHLSVRDVLEHHLSIKTGDQTPQQQRRLCAILERLGMQPTRKRINGSMKRLWLVTEKTVGLLTDDTDPVDPVSTDTPPSIGSDTQTHARQGIQESVPPVTREIENKLSPVNQDDSALPSTSVSGGLTTPGKFTESNGNNGTQQLEPNHSKDDPNSTVSRSNKPDQDVTDQEQKYSSPEVQVGELSYRVRVDGQWQWSNGWTTIANFDPVDFP